MAMILKSIFTLLVTVCFAGGAVYFGTQTGENDVFRDANVTGAVKTANIIKSEKHERTTENIGRKVMSREVTSHKGFGITLEHPHKSTDPQTGFMETLNEGKRNTFAKPEPVQTNKLTKLSNILRPSSKRTEDKNITIKQDPVDIPREPINVEDNVQRTVAAPKVDPPSLKNVEPATLPRQDVVQSHADEVQNLIPNLMQQIKAIKSAELKDQAYLDIVNYATERGQFAAADKALALIVQPELRDTARGQMAVFLARSGQTDKAFKIIDQVEIESLRDVLRLQTIEAIVLPPQYRSRSTMPMQ